MKNIAIFPGIRGPKRPDFERLIGPHINRLYRMAYHLCGSRYDAEDLVQDLLVKLYPKHKMLLKIDNLRVWLGTSLYNLFIDNHRRYARSPVTLVENETVMYESVAGGDPTPEEHLYRERHVSYILNALACLSDDQRSILILHDVEGYTLAEITGFTHDPLGTLKSRLHRARQRLRELIDK